MSTQKRTWQRALVCLGFLLAALGGWADAAPTEYGFGGLGAAVGGFKPQGNRFLVSETFIQDSSPRETMMYLPVAGPVSGMVIKADNSNLERFDLEDMRFYGYAADTIANMTITGTLAAGGTTSVTVTNKTLVLNASSSLVTDWGANLSAFVGVTQLSFDITMASGSRVDDIDFQSITIDNEFINLPGVTPTTQASNLGAVVIGPTETTLSWTNGNGSNRILFALAGTAGTPTVTDGTSYTPNANFSSATDIGGGWRCLYRGSGNMATVSGFAASSTYRFVVFEMDGAGPGSKYLTTVGTNAGNVTTIGSSFLTWSSGTARTLNAENFWSWPSGDLDSSNNTYVLHRYAGDGTTEVQKWNGSAWSTLTSFTPAAAGCVSFSDRTATDVTGVDTLHMVTGASFGSGSSGARGIQYGLYSGGSWSFSTAVSVSDPNGYKNTGAHALAVDAGGAPHLLYLWDDANTRTEYFVLRSRSGGTWSDTRTLSTIVNSNSYNEVKDDFLLLIDSSNRFHILYLRETSQGVRDLRYATNSPSGTWSDTVLVSGNGENLSSLTGGLDSNGKVHMALAFGALGSDGTRYMTNASGSWVATNLAPGGSGYWPAGLRLKSNNDMAISLVGPSNTKVLLKQGTSPWYVGVALAGPTTPEGYYVVTFTSDNKVMTAYANYLDTRPRELQYRLASLTPSFTVSFQTDGTAGATLSGTTNQAVAPGGDSTAVTANVPTGYHFVNWTGTGGFTSTANPVTVTNVTQAMTITANYAINQYAVTFQTDGTAGAGLTGVTSQMVNHGASSSAVTATAPTGFHLVNWTGTGGFTSTANPVTVTNVTQAMTITAHFAINQYAVTFLTDGTAGAGLTGSTNQTVTHGDASSAVTAIEPTGYHFVNWTGTGGFTSTANPVTVTNVTQAMTITANYAINQYAVTFQTDGTAGAGLTGATSQMVNHGASSSAVTATAPTGFHLVNWTGTGGFTSTANPVTVTNVTQAMTHHRQLRRQSVRGDVPDRRDGGREPDRLHQPDGNSRRRQLGSDSHRAHRLPLRQLDRDRRLHLHRQPGDRHQRHPGHDHHRQLRHQSVCGDVPDRRHGGCGPDRSHQPDGEPRRQQLGSDSQCPDRLPPRQLDGDRRFHLHRQSGDRHQRHPGHDHHRHLRHQSVRGDVPDRRDGGREPKWIHQPDGNPWRRQLGSDSHRAHRLPLRQLDRDRRLHLRRQPGDRHQRHPGHDHHRPLRHQPVCGDVPDRRHVGCEPDRSHQPDGEPRRQQLGGDGQLPRPASTSSTGRGPEASPPPPIR